MAKPPVGKNPGLQPITNDGSITPAAWQASGGDLSGAWTVAAHWSVGSVPGAANAVDIGTGLIATADWTVTAASETVNSLTLDAGNFGTLAVSGAMDVTNGLSLESGTLLAGSGAIITAASLSGGGGNLIVDGGAIAGGTTAELDGVAATIEAGGTLTADNLWLAKFGASNLNLEGATSALDLTGELEVGLDGSVAHPFTEGFGQLDITGGAKADASALYVTNTSTVSVDSQSAIVIGGGPSVAGAISIAMGATATVESVQITANIVDNGTLTALLNVLAASPGSGPSISGALSGDGHVLVSSAFTLDVTSATLFTGSIAVAHGGELLLDTGTTGATSVAFAGGSVDLRGQTYVTGMMPSYDSGTGILTVGSDTLDVGLGLSSGLFTAATDHNGGTLVTEAPCYVAGTTILTERGEVPVESLRPGDRVITAARRLAPVRWVGRMRVDLARHPSPQHAQPIRIAANAFSSGVPCRDLLVSPDHALLAEGVLIPARRLVNGASIRAETALDTVTYVHVELDCHDLLLAEGLAAESYLDTGNRGSFAGNAGPRRLHPDLASDPAAASLAVFAERACLPLVIDGPEVRTAHAALLARAKLLGHDLSRDPALDVRCDADGMTVTPDGARGLLLCVPATASRVRVRSRGFVPDMLDPCSGDGRRLGAALAVRLNGRAFPARGFGAGWYEPDAGAGWRWSAGDATLKLSPRKRPAMLSLHLIEAGARYWVEPTPAAIRAA
jgi:hypothetical protein